MGLPTTSLMPILCKGGKYPLILLRDSLFWSQEIEKMQCMHYVPSLSVTMGSYTLVDHFFVVDILDTNVILVVQWLITLGKITIDWEALQME